MYNKSFHCRCSYCQVRPPILSLKEKKDGLYASVYGSQWWRFGSAYAATTEDISGLADSYYTANTTCQGEGYLDALCGSHGQAAKIAGDNSFPFLMLHFFFVLSGSCLTLNFDLSSSGLERWNCTPSKSEIQNVLLHNYCSPYAVVSLSIPFVPLHN